MNLPEQILFEEDAPNVEGIIHLALDSAEPIYNGNVERNNIIRNRNYYEIIISNYADMQFKEHFRMSRQTFQVLLNCIGNINEEIHRTIPLEKKVLFTIWILSKPESFLAAGDRFGLPKSSGHQIFNHIVTLICQLIPEYIRWPENHLHTVNTFRNRSRGIPGIVGVIDGCHIPIKQPVGNPHDYYNRKQFHSVILQGICDEKAQFIDVNIGQPERMHDARVFRLSPIYERLMDPMNPLLPQDRHIIGDTAYPLLMNLMKPYQDNGHLTPVQQVFNNKLSSVRSTIERAFGLLKVKFRRLKYLDVNSPETASQIVAAACVLHNFIIQQNNVADDYNIEILNIENNDNIIEEPGQERGIAEDKRQALVHICNNYVI